MLFMRLMHLIELQILVLNWFQPSAAYTKCSDVCFKTTILSHVNVRPSARTVVHYLYYIYGSRFARNYSNLSKLTKFLLDLKDFCPQGHSKIYRVA